ncbi:MAG: LPXTG cell wall anchor domain-containing protein [Oscillospiraceae bacterium]|nr:LPXTG cell wall anchor domain-containing protein [Oscillospiraceae bacterium]
MKGLWKRIAALLTVCLLVIPLVGIGSAASAPDLNSLCSLTVTAHLSDDPDVTAELVNNFAIDIYRVAYLQDGLTFDVQPAFTALADDLGTEGGKVDTKALAQKALLIATDDGYMGDFQSGLPLNTPIEDLEAGLYLVVARGVDQDRAYVKEIKDEDTGESFYASAVTYVNYEYVFSPVLVTLPTNEGGDDTVTANDGNWIYHKTISLKVDRNAHSQKKIILHKEGETGLRLPDAEFKLYATRFVDGYPSDDTITAYVEGEGFVTLYCVGTYTTDKNGDIVLDAPLLDDNTLYAWVETKAPAGYVLDSNPHFFYAYGMEVPNDYVSWMNQPGVLETHLRYDNEHPNGTGGVTFDRQTSGDLNEVTLSNATEAQPVCVRVKAYDSYEGYINGESLGDFEAIYNGDSWTYDSDDGYYYYNEILNPGETADSLLVMATGTELTDIDGYSLPRAGRLAIVYNFIPAQYDGEGNPIDPRNADWNWDPQSNGVSEMSLNSNEGMIRPMAEAKGGYQIELGGSDGDLRATGTARIVEQCNYSWDYKDSDSENGITIKNKPDEPTPPDNPGVLLPETGGIGTTLFTVIGGGMIAIALLLLPGIKRRRRQA